MVFASILFVADANERRFHQAHNSCQYLLPRQARQTEILLHAFPYRRQDRPEDGHAFILGFVTYFAPTRMVSALLSASSVASGDLQMSLGILANPHVGPGGRNDQGFYTGEGISIAYGFVFRIDVLKAFAPGPAMGSRGGFGDVAYPRHFCGINRIGNDFSQLFASLHSCRGLMQLAGWNIESEFSSGGKICQFLLADGNRGTRADIDGGLRRLAW